MTKYLTHDEESFNRKLPARQYVVDTKDVSHKEAEELIEEVDDSDEDTLDVFTFRVVEHWSAEKTVKVKATCEDEAEERAEKAMLNEEIQPTHKLHDEIHKLSKVDEAPRSKIENGEYYEEAKNDQ